MRFPHLRSVVLLSLGLALTAFGRTYAQPASASTPDAGGTTRSNAFDGEFVSEAGKFSLRLPPGYSQPEGLITRLPLSGDENGVDLHSFTSTRGDDLATFSFLYVGEKIEMAGHEKQILDVSRDNVLQSLSATLEKEMDIVIGGHPGRMMIFSFRDNNKKRYGRLQMYMANPATYQMMCISADRASLESPEINAYFASFKLVGN